MVTDLSPEVAGAPTASGNYSCVEWTPPDPPLRSDEIVLRLFRPDDASAVVEACRDPAIGRFTFMQEGLALDDALAVPVHEATVQGRSPRRRVVVAAFDRPPSKATVSRRTATVLPIPKRGGAQRQ